MIDNGKSYACNDISITPESEKTLNKLKPTVIP